MISVLLTVYGRPQNLDLQIEAIKKQSIQPSEIIIVVDKNNRLDFDENKYSDFQIVKFSKNIGVWGRFSIALLTSNPYICIFDDDTIPGKRWFENCLNTYNKVDGILGTVGVLFNKGALGYEYSARVGWPSANEKIEVVDIVGHSWFFKRKHLEEFWHNTDAHYRFKKSGEDIHFSYILKRNLGLNTFVPPHPANDTSFWGSLPEYAQRLGSDENALSLEAFSTLRMSKYMKKVREDGFLFVSEKENQQVSREIRPLNKMHYYKKGVLNTLKLLLKKIIRTH